MNNIEMRVDALEGLIKDLQKTVSSFQLDKDSYVKKGASIKPGYGCKVYFNSNGLIEHSGDLSPDDIPNIPISKVIDLRDTLSHVVNEKGLGKIVESFDNRFNDKKVVKSGCKVNVNEYGIVENVSDLLVDDIPKLPLSHIEGLEEVLSNIPNITPTVDFIHTSITPATACKVTFDNTGHIIGYQSLSVEDLPPIINERLNHIEKALPDLVPSDTISGLVESMNKKLEKKYKLIPGEYVKFEIDEDGLIKAGYRLNPNDIPELPLSKITGLYDRLNDTVSREEFNTVLNKLTEIQSSINKPDNRKPDNRDMVDFQAIINDVIGQFELLRNAVEDNQFIPQIDQINMALSNISSRIAVLENKLDIK